MTDLEISKALALAIGYELHQVTCIPSDPPRITVMRKEGSYWTGRTFDYRDWNVIGPIAEKFDCFPEKYNEGWYAAVGYRKAVLENTPQRAIAMAVIQGAKK